MGAYAYIGIAEAVLYLGIAIAISYTHIDHLIIYALLMSIVSITVLVAMCIYCSKKNWNIVDMLNAGIGTVLKN